MSLREPRLLGDEMGVSWGEARGETPRNTASQIQRGSASLQSTPTEHWNRHSWPDGAGATPDTFSIAYPHPCALILSVQETHTNQTPGLIKLQLIQSPLYSRSLMHCSQKWQGTVNQWKTSTQYCNYSSVTIKAEIFSVLICNPWVGISNHIRLHHLCVSSLRQLIR